MGIRVCRTGKQDYPTQAKAEQVLATIRQNNLNSALSGLHVPNRVYECEHCGGWHLTHRKQKRK
jgi:hypothetical protein